MERFNILINTFRNIILVLILSVSWPIKGQTTSFGSSPQFLFPEFNTGVVKMRNGLSQSARLNFNSVSEKVVYEKENEVYDLINIGMIDAVIINDRIFVPVGKVFHEILLIAPIPLLVRHRGEIISPGSQVGYGGKSLVSSVGTLTSVKLSMGYFNLKLPVDYTVKVENVYLTRIKGNACSFINERQFLKLFEEKTDELKDFIKKNHIKFDSSSDIIMLLRYCNELFPPGIRMS